MEANSSTESRSPVKVTSDQLAKEHGVDVTFPGATWRYVAGKMPSNQTRVVPKAVTTVAQRPKSQLGLEKRQSLNLLERQDKNIEPKPTGSKRIDTAKHMALAPLYPAGVRHLEPEVVARKLLTAEGACRVGFKPSARWLGDKSQECTKPGWKARLRKMVHKYSPKTVCIYLSRHRRESPAKTLLKARPQNRKAENRTTSEDSKIISGDHCESLGESDRTVVKRTSAKMGKTSEDVVSQVQQSGKYLERETIMDEIIRRNHMLGWTFDADLQKYSTAGADSDILTNPDCILMCPDASLTDLVLVTFENMFKHTQDSQGQGIKQSLDGGCKNDEENQLDKRLPYNGPFSLSAISESSRNSDSPHAPETKLSVHTISRKDEEVHLNKPMPLGSRKTVGRTKSWPTAKLKSHDSSITPLIFKRAVIEYYRILPNQGLVQRDVALPKGRTEEECKTKLESILQWAWRVALETSLADEEVEEFSLDQT